MHRKQYDRLVAVLRENGYEAEIDLLEYRSGDLPVAQDIIIHVGQAAAAAKGMYDVTQIVRRVLCGLRRGRSGESRRVVIYGPDGEVLRRVELPDDEDAADEAHSMPRQSARRSSSSCTT
jgi:hypothetical protein